MCVCRGDNHVAVFCQTVDRDIGFDPATVIQHLGVNQLAFGYIDITGAQLLQKGAGIIALDQGFAERALIKHHDPGAGRATFLCSMFIPVWPVMGVDVFGLFAWRGKPHSSLPASGLAEAGIVCREAVMQWALACRACGFVLPVGPMHVINRAERFCGAFI